MAVDLFAHAPGTLVETAAARVALCPPTGRLSLRAQAQDGLAPLEGALGLTLPDRIGGCAVAGDVRALCLGPDEWTIDAPPEAVPGLLAASAAVYPTVPHSLVDISGRETTLAIDGPQATDLLSIGCARDVEAIAIGEGRRTGFDGTMIVLWRDGPDAFRLDVWHSFAPHLLGLLETGCRELAVSINGH